MISIKSLSENLLPNLYLKKATLDSTQQTVTSLVTKKTGYGQIATPGVGGASTLLTPETTLQPSETLANCNISLSMKFLRNSAFESEILKLFDAGLDQYVDIYIHQFQNVDGGADGQNTYQEILEDPSAFKNQLTTVFNLGYVTTIKMPFGELFQPAMLNMASQENLTNLGGAYNTLASGNDIDEISVQTLPDGTSLYEILINKNFGFNTNTDFLAYIFVANIRNQLVGEPVNSENVPAGFISKPASEIVILDGKVQNEGIMFTIAPYRSDITEGERKKLKKFGNPGDIWGGGVHLHEIDDGLNADGEMTKRQVFMAGSIHTPNKPHPFLDPSIVPLNKIIDNRIKQKVESNLINITKAFNILNNNVSSTKYKLDAANVLDFKNNKSVSYVSNFYLSQGSEGNINGAFSIDKYKLLESKCALRFLFQKSKAIPGGEAYLLNLSKLESLSLYERTLQSSDSEYGPQELLCTVTGESSPLTYFGIDNTSKTNQISKIDPGNLAKANIETIFNKQGFDLDNSGDYSYPGSMHYCFKRKRKANKTTKLQYCVEISYSDPTINIMKSIAAKMSLVIKDMNNITSVPYNNFSTINAVEVGSNSESNSQVLSSALNLINDFGFKIFIYDFNYDFEDFQNYFKSLTTFDKSGYYYDKIKKQETDTNFLVATNFLQNFLQTINIALDNFGSKPLKSSDGTAESNVYAVNKSKIFSNIAPPEPKIYFKSKQNEIEVYDHGYDFTGYLKNIPLTLEGKFSTLPSIVKEEFVTYGLQGFSKGRREDEGLPTITVPLYKGVCRYLAYKLVPFQNVDGTVLEQTYRPLGLSTNFNVEDSAYSYLNIPPNFARYCVFLPESTINKATLFSPAFNATLGVKTQILFFNIIKFKNKIFEDNLKTTSIEASTAVTLQEDMLSVLNSFGFRVPEIIDLDYTKDLLEITPGPAAPTPATAIGALQEELGGGFIDSDIDPAINQSKASSGGNVGSKQLQGASNSQFIQQGITAQSSLPFTYNFFLGSIIDRKLFTFADTFNLSSTTFNSNFKPWSEENDGGKAEYARYHTQGLDNFAGAGLSGLPDLLTILESFNGPFVPPPLQAASLSYNHLAPYPFKDYRSGDFSYMRGGTINPYLLSLFWFNHQNIVRVEYLQGYDKQTIAGNLSSQKTSNFDGYDLDQPKELTEETNIKTPRWAVLNKNVIDQMFSGQKYLCRLMRYDYPHYINKRLVNKLNLPLINNYFVLENTLNGTSGAAGGTGPAEVNADGDPIAAEDPGPVPGGTELA